MTTYHFHTLQFKAYSEFRVDDSIECKLPKLIYRLRGCVLFLHRDGTDTHLPHTQILERCDQK